MKKLISIFSLSLMLVHSASAIAAGDPEVEKTKAYTRSYALESGDKVSLDNKFGEMKISTWSKNEIKVDVNVIVKADDNEQAQRLLDAINIKDGKNGSEIFFKTSLKDDKDDNDDDDQNGNNKGRRNGGNNTSFRINYTVYLPSGASLDASNMFGDLLIGDFNGPLSIESKFGSLTTGALSQVKKVLVQFGNKVSTIESVSGGKLSIQFSQAIVNKLSGEISADFNQSHGVKIRLDNSLKKLDVNNNFSELEIDAPKNLSASFKINTSFGKFSNESDFTAEREVDAENMYRVNGSSFVLKGGSGAVRINIKSNFGSLKLGHHLTFDAVLMKKPNAKGRL